MKINFNICGPVFILFVLTMSLHMENLDNYKNSIVQMIFDLNMVNKGTHTHTEGNNDKTVGWEGGYITTLDSWLRQM